MLLAIDIGNSNINIGCFEGENLRATFRSATRAEDTSDEVALQLSQFLAQRGLPKPTDFALASVVPRLTPVWRQVVEAHYGLEPLFVTAKVKLNIKISYPNPHEIGADRLCNAAAAYDRYGGPVIVVDFGTATNFDVISEAGAYVGGVLAPGLETSHLALARRAAQLFRVTMQKPERVIGQSTEQALQSGFFHGAVGQTDYLISLIAAELGDNEKLTVVATGGLATAIAAESRYISVVDPQITLQGLRLIHQLNSTRKI